MWILFERIFKSEQVRHVVSEMAYSDFQVSTSTRNLASPKNQLSRTAVTWLYTMSSFYQFFIYQLYRTNVLSCKKSEDYFREPHNIKSKDNKKSIFWSCLRVWAYLTPSPDFKDKTWLFSLTSDSKQIAYKLKTLLICKDTFTQLTLISLN